MALQDITAAESACWEEKEALMIWPAGIDSHYSTGRRGRQLGNSPSCKSLVANRASEWSVFGMALHMPSEMFGAIKLFVAMQTTVGRLERT
jgi:hypothetical protein